MPLQTLRAASTAGTVLQPIVNSLNAAGVQTAPTTGAVMDALNLNQAQMDSAFCYCVNGVEIPASAAADRVAQFA